MSGLYWSLTFLDLSSSIEKLNKNEIIDFVKRNQHENGGFGPSDGHEPHLLYSLSAIQVSFYSYFYLIFNLKSIKDSHNL